MNNLEAAPYLRVIKSERYKDREGNEKNHQTEVGKAWIKKTGSGESYVSIRLYDGICVAGEVAIFAPLPRDDERRQGGRGRGESLPRGRR